MTENPFKGLSPFYEEDADFFCGRDCEVLNVKNSLQVHRLTILHGVPGVGKTSLLNAGVAHRLIRDAARNRERWGFPGFAVAVFPQAPNPQAWISDPLSNLIDRIRNQMQMFGIHISDIDNDRGIEELLGVVTEKLGNPRGNGRLYLILDQFEAYLEHAETLLTGDDFHHSFVQICRNIDL